MLAVPAAIRPEGKNNRLFVFSISMSSVSRLSLDVAADTHEDLLDWVKKIREAAQTADARVSLGSPWQGRRRLLDNAGFSRSRLVGDSEVTACDGWQSSYRDGKAGAILDNVARGGGHTA